MTFSIQSGGQPAPKPEAGGLPEHKITVTAPGTTHPIHPNDPGPVEVIDNPEPGTPEPTPPQTLRPEKYKSDEEWRKGYDELQKLYTQMTQKQAQGNADAPEEGEGDTNTPPALGESLNTFFEEYGTKGALSEDSYGQLEAMGLGKDVVDAFIEGRQAIEARERNALLEVVGGEEKYKSMSEWASANYSDEQLEAFNSAMNAGDTRLAQMAMRTLKSDYTEANGTSNALTGQKGGDNSDVFRSNAELTVAMADPRYSRDAAYRADVEAKLKRSQGVLGSTRI
jgi:hypothetical protein